LSSVSSSRTRGSNASTPTLSSLSSDEDEAKQEELIRKSRQARLQEVRRKHRKRKPAKEIEDGEVDSEGEHFEPAEDSEELDGEDLEKYDLASIVQETDPSEVKQEAQVNQTENISPEIPGHSPGGESGCDEVKIEAVRKVGEGAKNGVEHESDGETLLSSSEEEGGDADEAPLEVASGDVQAREDANDAANEGFEDADDADREDQKRMERQRKERLRRMQAFQQKTEIREEEDDHEDGEENPAQDLQSSEFYKSFYEEEQKKKEGEDEKDDAAALAVVAGDGEGEGEAGPSRKTRSPKRGKKSREEKIREGVGFWSQFCSADDGVKEGPKNADLPTKEEVEKQQEEMESLTWADRWYQNKKVQNVVKNSKIMSKVRSQIKIRDLKAKPAAEVSAAEHFEELPKIIGSMEEYAQIVGKTTKEIDEALVKRREESDEESEDENDDVWATILGKPKE
jgi:hypothetical protein